MATEEGSQATIACPECGHENTPGNKFCESCGVSLASARKTNRDPAQSARQRRAAASELGVAALLAKARQRVGNIRLFLFASAALTGLGFLMLLRIDADPTSLWITGVAGALYLALGWLVPKAPLPILLTAAGLQTVSVIITLSVGQAPGLLDIVVLIGLWGTVPVIARAQAVVNKHRDLLGDDAFESTTTRLRNDRRARARSGEDLPRARANSRRSRTG